MAGAIRTSNPSDTRLPITPFILNKLLHAIKITIHSVYDRLLFTAMFLFAFNAFARVGEICLAGNVSNIIQLQDVHIKVQGTNPIICVCFSRFKHNFQGIQHNIQFGHGPSIVSASKAVQMYMKARGKLPGPLFLTEAKQSVPRSLFDKKLTTLLRFCKLNDNSIKGHSFRIGAASYASAMGLSDSRIRALGRWHSNAFKRYVRTSFEK